MTKIEVAGRLGMIACCISMIVCCIAFGALVLLPEPKPLPEPEPKIPQECTTLCEKFGGAGNYNNTKGKPVVRCNDNMFIDEDSTEKCESHGGVKYQTVLKPTAYCICNDGSSGYAKPQE